MVCQSLFMLRRSIMAATRALKVMVLAHISTMIPIMEALRVEPRFGSSRLSPPEGGKSGSMGGGPPILGWVNAGISSVSRGGMFCQAASGNVKPHLERDFCSRRTASGSPIWRAMDTSEVNMDRQRSSIFFSRKESGLWACNRTSCLNT